MRGRNGHTQQRGLDLFAWLEPGTQARCATVELVPPFPRSDLDPALSPFTRAVRHLSDLIPQVQVLLREDLDDLAESLCCCLQQARSDEERAQAAHALALFECLHDRLPSQLPLLVDCLQHRPAAWESERAAGEEPAPFQRAACIEASVLQEGSSRR